MKFPGTSLTALFALSLLAFQQPTTAATLFSDSLVLDLPLNGNVADASTNNFPTTAFGGTFVQDKVLQPLSALKLNGTGDCVEAPFNSQMYPHHFTLSLWVKFDSLNLQTVWRTGNATTDGWRGWFIGTETGNRLIYNDHTGATYNAQLVATNLLSTNEWIHLAITRTANTATMFLNGIPVATQTGLTAWAKPQLAAMLLGANYDFSGNRFLFLNGTLDAVHIYNRALTDSEVADLYAYEAAPSPTLSIAVKTVRISMEVVLGQSYQLQSSTNLLNWSNEGAPFTADGFTAFQDVDVLSGNRFFRLLQIP